MVNDLRIKIVVSIYCQPFKTLQYDYKTHERIENQSGIHISGTPTSDPNSVMNSFVLPWNGFTSADVLATQILYPQ
jgi:hypothetical protein